MIGFDFNMVIYFLGEELSDIVDDYAKSQDRFIEDFMETLEQMLENGYTDGELIEL